MRLLLSEGQSAIYSWALYDESGLPMPLAALDGLYLTLYDRLSGEIINSRDHQNVLNAHGVTFAATSGRGQWVISPEDTPIKNDALDFEEHVALFEAVWSSGERKLPRTVEMQVRNLAKRP